ncbi:MAG: tetratricopeptide repeat protein [Candidatus Melainabacteria bacterium]|nr:tetratricopeptide repeat protein [Candidatus Melainabacteria bacterium]
MKASAPAHHGPTAAQIRRQETSGSNDLEKRTDLERSYRAYDQGLSEWFAGNYSQAAKHLNDAYELYSDFHGSRDVLDSLYLYDLGQAAEAAGELGLAKNSYQRSLRRRPDFADCCIRLTGILTRSGESALALVYARRLAEKNPQDPRAQFLLANMLERAGFAEESKTAKENFNLLMKGGTVNRPQSQTRPGEADSSPAGETAPETTEKKSEPAEKVETDSESGAEKKESNGDKDNDAKEDASKKPES